MKMQLLFFAGGNYHSSVGVRHVGDVAAVAADVEAELPAVLASAVQKQRAHHSAVTCSIQMFAVWLFW